LQIRQVQLGLVRYLMIPIQKVVDPMGNLIPLNRLDFFFNVGVNGHKSAIIKAVLL
jgi:hypothetical protein